MANCAHVPVCPIIVDIVVVTFYFPLKNSAITCGHEVFPWFCPKNILFVWKGKCSTKYVLKTQLIKTTMELAVFLEENYFLLK
jgi:hypothetical protein